MDVGRNLVGKPLGERPLGRLEDIRGYNEYYGGNILFQRHIVYVPSTHFLYNLNNKFIFFSLCNMFQPFMAIIS
jgi:hypothetical protein